jgi:hypothetical protein
LPAIGEAEPISASPGHSEQAKPSRLTNEEFFSEAWRTAQPPTRTETRSRSSKKKRQIAADTRQLSIFPSEDEQRERISENEGQAAGETFSPEKYREKSIETLRERYSSYREYRTDGDESRIYGIAVARKHDGSALVLNPIGGEITDFTADEAAERNDFLLIEDAIHDERLNDGIVMTSDRLSPLETRPADQNAGAEIADAAPTQRPQSEQPYRVGDEVYLDDGANYRIERIEPDSVTLNSRAGRRFHHRFP